ncbi:MAG: LysE family translocator, partial [bacterium]
GPSNIYVMARAIGQGTKAGIVAAFGLATGSMVHVMATVLGISALFKHSPTAYLVVKIMGALYLIYLGIKYFTDSGPGDLGRKENANHKSLSAIFFESIVVEVTNPKTALFFLAFLPQFVVPETGSIPLQLFILGVIVTVSALPCDILVASSSSKMANWMAGSKRAQQIQMRVSGSILFGMGTYIAVDELLISNNQH